MAHAFCVTFDAKQSTAERSAACPSCRDAPPALHCPRLDEAGFDIGVDELPAYRIDHDVACAGYSGRDMQTQIYAYEHRHASHVHVQGKLAHGYVRTPMSDTPAHTHVRKRTAAASSAAGSSSGAVHSIRMARRFVVDRQALSLLTGKYAAHFAGRQGGYTRLLKAGIRPGDNAPMVIVELVGVVVVAPLDGSAATEVAVGD